MGKIKEDLTLHEKEWREKENKYTLIIEEQTEKLSQL